MRSVRERDALDGRGRDIGGDMRGVPRVLELGGGEWEQGGMHLQCGVQRGSRRAVWGVSEGNVQADQRIDGVCVVWEGNVLGGCRGEFFGDVRGMSAAHGLE